MKHHHSHRHDPEPVIIIDTDGWDSPDAIASITREDGYNFYLAKDLLYLSHSTVRKMYKLKERDISKLLPTPCLLTENPHRPSTMMRLYDFRRVLEIIPPDTRA